MGMWYPDSWCVPEMLDYILDFLKEIDISLRDKKEGLMMWCACADVPITAEMVEYVTGLPAGEV